MTSSRKLRQLRQTPEAMDRCQPCEREKMDPSQRHVFPDVTCTWILSVWPLQAYLRTCKQAVRAYHTRLQRHRKNLEHAVSWRWARAESTCVELTLPRFSTKSTPIQSRFLQSSHAYLYRGRRFGGPRASRKQCISQKEGFHHERD